MLWPGRQQKVGTGAGLNPNLSVGVQEQCRGSPGAQQPVAAVRGGLVQTQKHSVVAWHTGQPKSARITSTVLCFCSFASG